MSRQQYQSAIKQARKALKLVQKAIEPLDEIVRLLPEDALADGKMCPVCERMFRTAQPRAKYCGAKCRKVAEGRRRRDRQKVE